MRISAASLQFRRSYPGGLIPVVLSRRSYPRGSKRGGREVEMTMMTIAIDKSRSLALIAASRAGPEVRIVRSEKHDRENRIDRRRGAIRLPPPRIHYSAGPAHTTGLTVVVVDEKAAFSRSLSLSPPPPLPTCSRAFPPSCRTRVPFPLPPSCPSPDNSERKKVGFA